MVKTTLGILSAGIGWLAVGGRWIWAAGALISILMAILVWQVRASHGEIDTLRTDLAASEGEVALLRQAREADAAAMAARDASRASIIEKEARRSAALQAALSENEDWANTPVPAAVIDSLRD